MGLGSLLGFMNILNLILAVGSGTLTSLVISRPHSMSWLASQLVLDPKSSKERVSGLVFAHSRPIFFIYAPIAMISGMYILCRK